MTNSFDKETHDLFFSNGWQECWWCGANHADCGHHIFGRGYGDGPESSPLNYAPLNNQKCHIAIHGRISTDAGRKRLLEKTISYLVSLGYKLDDRDNAFLEKYKDHIARLKLNI